MYSPPFPLLPGTGGFPSADMAVYPSAPHAQSALAGYIDAYLFHRHLCERLNQGQAPNLDELLPPFSPDDAPYLETFSAFVIRHTLPAIRQIFYESGHSNLERRALTDAVLCRLRKPDKLLAEEQARALKI